MITVTSAGVSAGCFGLGYGFARIQYTVLTTKRIYRSAKRRANAIPYFVSSGMKVLMLLASTAQINVEMVATWRMCKG